MTESLLGLMDKELEKTANRKMIDELEKRLGDKGIEAQKLVVAYLNGSDIFLGEVPEEDLLSHTWKLTLHNPRRIFRMAKMTQQGLEVQMFIGDVELLEPGSILEIAPVIRYGVKHQPADTKIALYRLLLEHFDAKIIQAAAKQGIIAPR